MSGEDAGDLAIAIGYTQSERWSGDDARARFRQPRSRTEVNARILADWWQTGERWAKEECSVYEREPSST
jgi:hypothetical protein